MERSAYFQRLREWTSIRGRRLPDWHNCPQRLQLGSWPRCLLHHLVAQRRARTPKRLLLA
jgi:hypothetical protein